MLKADRYLVDVKEITEILIRHSDIHEGHWGIFFEFGLAGGNISLAPPPEEHVQPAAIVLVQKLGIQRFDQPNPLSVDAAAVNPVKLAPPPNRPSRKIILREGEQPGQKEE